MELNDYVAEPTLSQLVCDGLAENATVVCPLGDLVQPCNVSWGSYVQEISCPISEPPQCIYWDRNLTQWSSEGCVLASNDTFGDGYLLCECTHLTVGVGGIQA